MKNKLFVLLAFVLAMSVISCVCAAENSTDIVSENIGDSQQIEVLEALENNDDEVLGNTSENESVKSPSSLSASKVVGYTTFSSDVSVKLTSDNKPLSSKTVKILINGVTYKRTTDKNGVAKVSLKLSKGSYNVRFTFDGDNQTEGSNATSKITIKDAVKTKLKVGDKYINYRQGSKCLFYVKLINSAGKAIKNQMVTIKVSGKTYNVKTDKKGNAKVYLNLKKGTRKVTYSFKKTSPYLSSSGSIKLKVKSKMAKGNGYWLWPKHMKSISLKSLSKRGTKHLFLHVQALSVYGKSSVVSFIKKAHRYGIKVHMWMQICYSSGKWVSPVRDDGSFKYGFINKKISQAVYYAKIKGVDGVHFDYMRYGGTAHKHKNAVESINYIVKKASIKIHNARPNCIVSGALMPEPSMMEYYYGQDVPTISRYVDALLPMVYKGNYGQKRSWITSVTKTFAGQSNGAQIWTGLQSYLSDSNAKKLSHSELLKDAKAAKKGGAVGVVLFRIGISCNFNFKKV